MKKRIFLLFACVLFAVGLSACTNDEKKDSTQDTEDDFTIVATIFPEYDWVREITKGSDADLTLLLDSGVDLHSFQPTAEDLQKISTCDVFIYVGGESDEWVEDALKEAVNDDMVVINLMDELRDDIKEEEIIEGMEEEEKEEAEEDEVEYDEHVWLSLKNSKKLCEVIADKLSEANPKDADTYASNAEKYLSSLSELDEKYQTLTDEAEVKALVFADRFPFRYMTDDYGLTYYAAFVGCSAETEASFETIAFLAKKLDELNLKSVMTIEGKDKSIAETVVENTSDKDIEILTLDSMQSVTAKDVESGISYLSVMENNLSVLEEALK